MCMKSFTLSQEISEYPHRAVQRQYFEIAARYVRWAVANPQVLPIVLQAFLDQRYD